MNNNTRLLVVSLIETPLGMALDSQHRPWLVARVHSLAGVAIWTILITDLLKCSESVKHFSARLGGALRLIYLSAHPHYHPPTTVNQRTDWRMIEESEVVATWVHLTGIRSIKGGPKVPFGLPPPPFNPQFSTSFPALNRRSAAAFLIHLLCVPNSNASLDGCPLTWLI